MRRLFKLREKEGTGYVEKEGLSGVKSARDLRASVVDIGSARNVATVETRQLLESWSTWRPVVVVIENFRGEDLTTTWSGPLRLFLLFVKCKTLLQLLNDRRVRVLVGEERGSQRSPR